MYMHFIANYRHEVTWVSFFDIDEFLRISNDRSIEEFLASFDHDVDCILFNWIVFGTSNFKTNPPGLVLENYTRTAGDVNEYTKYICRASRLDDWKLKIADFAFGFWHNLIGKTAHSVRTVNVLGEPTNSMARYDEETSRRIKQAAVIHHYFMKSEEYALHRAMRGTKGAFAGQAMWSPDSPKAAKVLADQALFNSGEDLSLADFWRKRTARATQRSIAPSHRGVLLTEGCACSQSSISEWSKGATIEEDAAGAVNGIINGLEKFHTNNEDRPWWQIDLGATCSVTEIMIYNAAFHTCPRFQNFSISTSSDGFEWIIEYVKNDDEPVGNLFTGPFVYALQKPVLFRFMRITSIATNFLHLDQVQIFGERKI